MTYFEELCKSLNVTRGSGGEDIICTLLNNVIFGDKEYTEEETTEIVTTAYRAMTIP